MRKLLFITLSLIIHTNSFAQDSFCETLSTDIDFLLENNVSTEFDGRVVLTLRTFIHIIRQTDGTGGISESDAYSAHSVLESDYASSDILFELEGIDEIWDTDYYYNIRHNNYNIFNINSSVDRIDIYLIPDSTERAPVRRNEGKAENIPSTAFYLSGAYENATETINEELYNSSVLSHEMGHCLGLYHTFETSFCLELIDGTNCEDCGDLVCDTPPAPGTAWVVDEECNYNGDATEEQTGLPYEPDQENYMAYTFPYCMDHFSPEGQKERMFSMILNNPILLPVITDIDNYITIANRHFGDFDSNFEESTLSAFNFDNLDMTVENILSGNLVEIGIYDNYTLQTNHFSLVGNEGNERHYMWNENITDYKIRKENFEMFPTDEHTAWFKNQKSITIDCLLIDEIQFRDPWHITNPDNTPSNWNQPNNFISLSDLAPDGVYHVFTDIEPDQDVSYALKAKRFDAKIDGIYQLSGWDGLNVTINETIDFNSIEGFGIIELFFNEFGNNEIILGDPLYNNRVSDDANTIIEISHGGTFSIPAGANIQFGDNTQLKFSNGTALLVNGTESEPVALTSNTTVPAIGDWKGIKVESGNLVMNNCNLSYAEIGLQMEGEGTRTIHNSQITNCNIGVHSFGGTLNITNNCIVSENNTGVLIEQGHYVFLSGNSINLNHKVGVVLRHTSEGFIANNLISGNGTHTNPVIDVIAGGIFLHNSSPIIISNTIQQNQTHGITTMNGSQPILNYQQLGHNWIESNGSDEISDIFDSEIKWHDRSIPFLDVGHNDIMDDNGGYLIYGVVTPGDGLIPITRNYWADNDPNLFDRFYPLNAYDYQPYDTEPNVSEGQFTAVGAMFNQGLLHEENEEWTNAINTYTTIITSYPDNKEASGAVIRLFACTKMTNGDFTALQSYYDLLVSSYSDTDLSKTAEQYTILCDVAIQDFGTAIGKYEAILQNPPSLPDSVYAVIDIGQVYLASSVASGNGLGKKAALGTMPEYEPDDFSDYEQKSNDALGALLGRKGSVQNPTIPDEFSLHDNYPNPFNPTTTIQYDIPEFSHVSLVVYDITGREIIQLVNSKTLAGNHRVGWNGKDMKGNPVATGIYIYQLTAISTETNTLYTHSNKMVLLK